MTRQKSLPNTFAILFVKNTFTTRCPPRANRGRCIPLTYEMRYRTMGDLRAIAVQGADLGLGNLCVRLRNVAHSLSITLSSVAY